MQDTEATTSTSRRVSNDCIAECRSRSMSSLTQGVLLDVRIGARDVRLGLVVVVVRHEVLDRVVREELLELRASCAARVLLCAITSVGRWICCDDVGHGERLARARDAEQRLMLLAGVDARG